MHPADEPAQDRHSIHKEGKYLNRVPRHYTYLTDDDQIRNVRSNTS